MMAGPDAVIVLAAGGERAPRTLYRPGLNCGGVLGAEDHRDRYPSSSGCHSATSTRSSANTRTRRAFRSQSNCPAAGNKRGLGGPVSTGHPAFSRSSSRFAARTTGLVSFRCRRSASVRCGVYSAQAIPRAAGPPSQLQVMALTRSRTQRCMSQQVTVLFADLLGHSSIAITGDVHRHTSDNAARARLTARRRGSGCDCVDTGSHTVRAGDQSKSLSGNLVAMMGHANRPSGRCRQLTQR